MPRADLGDRAAAARSIRSTEPIHVGSSIRIADAARLGAALRGNTAQRPEPGQMLCAGKLDSVARYVRGPSGRPSYALRDAPGFWLEEWIDPVAATGPL